MTYDSMLLLLRHCILSIIYAPGFHKIFTDLILLPGAVIIGLPSKASQGAVSN